MKYVELIRKNSNRLFVTTLVLFALTLLFPGFPIFVFIALAPLFAVLDVPNGFRKSYWLVIITAMAGLVVYFIRKEASVLNTVLYGIFVFILFWGFTEVNRVRQNILNKFALIIFLLGAEYIVVKYVSAHHGVFLADLVQQKTEWTRWNIHTGYLGTGLWILSANLLFYQAIFKSESVKKSTLLTAILFILLPIIYSLNLSNPAITRTDMTLLYLHNESENTYSRNGELISRTGAWVSVLIVIFTIVKNKTKQK